MGFEKKKTKICPICGMEFGKPYNYSTAQWENRISCSKKCSSKLIQKVDIPSDLLRDLYLNKKLSSQEIGDIYNISATHTRRLLRKSGIEIRDNKTAHKISHNRPGFIKKAQKNAIGRKLSEQAKEKLRALYGTKSATWKGGITMSNSGYLVFTSSRANGKYAGKAFHSLIAEKKLGRPLRPNEVIHHIDGNKLNNDPDNIMVTTQSEHCRIHLKERYYG